MLDWIDSYDTRRWQTTTEGSIRYALLGLGWWTVDVALPAIEASNLGKVTTFVSSSTEKAERLADESGVSHGVSYNEFCKGEASNEFDAVYIGTPNVHHLKYVKAAADLDKAVICEKPMEATVERAERMVETCESAGVPLMIAYRMHTDPAVQRAKELIEDGFLGDPVSVYGHNSQPLLNMISDPDQWRLDPDLSGYGTSVMDLGIYSINTARYLLDRDPIAVQSQMSSHHEAFKDVPDERSSAILVLEDNIKMITTDSQNAYEDTTLKITGTEGQIKFQPAFHGEVSLHLSRNEVTVQINHETFDAEREMEEEFDYFADCILCNKTIHADGRHGLQDMKIIQAIHKSAKTNEIVEL